MPDLSALTNATTNVTVAQDDTQLFAAVADRRIRVYSLAVTQASVVASSLSRLIFRSIGTGATTALSGSIHVPAGGLVWPYHERGWFQTAWGDGLFFSTPGQSMTLHIGASCITR